MSSFCSLGTASASENFDLTRVYFQFFEREIAGIHIERRTVQLPNELPGSIRDQL
jgi:hypothetical protein